MAPSTKRMKPNPKGKSLHKRRRTDHKPKKRVTNKVIAAKIQKITRRVNAGLANHTRRVRSFGDLSTSDGGQNIYQLDVSTKTLLEGAVANFRFFNPSTPGTLTTADMSTGSYHQNIVVESQFAKVTMRANYGIPLNISCYYCIPRKDTGITPQTAWQNGLNDQTLGPALATHILSSPTDSVQFNNLWRIAKSKKFTLQAGKSRSVSISHDRFTFDPSLFDNHQLAYQRKYGGLVLMIVVSGVVCHDGTGGSDKQGNGNAQVDVQYDTKWKFEYDAGTDLNDYSYAYTDSGIVLPRYGVDAFTVQGIQQP